MLREPPPLDFRMRRRQAMCVRAAHHDEMRSWFDALIWAYADEHGLDPLWSEDFEDGRLYGRVKVVNPFRTAVHEPSARYGR